MPDEAELRRVNLAVARWEQLRDPDAIEQLDRVLSPDLVFHRADGSVTDKPRFMAGLAGPSPFAGRESEMVSADVDGSRAIVVVLVTTTDAAGTSATFRNVRCLAWSDGRWQIEYWFNERWEEPAHAS